ncbi:MAG: DUF1538 domain-containing protein [Clostridia bacterium]
MKKFKLNDSLMSVLPIALIVIFLSITIVPVSAYDLTLFVISTIFLVFGMELFNRGTERSMLPMGENIGSNLSKSRKLTNFVICSLLFGFIITLAEPDLLVLAGQVLSINKWVFIIAVAIGVSIYMLIAVLRIIFQVKITYVLFITYFTIIVLMFFVPESLLAITFDAGAVTSGAISVPFILALGAGISAVRASKNSKDDSFGLIALTSAGPIIVTMILCLFIEPNVEVTRTVITESVNQNFINIFGDFGKAILDNMFEIFIILVPIALIFFVFNAKELKLPRSRIRKIVMGLIYTYLGLTLFLSGVSVGYLKLSSIIGYQIAKNYDWLLIPLSLIFGLVIAFAEPAIQILNKKIEDITSGIIRKKVLFITLAIGISVSMVMAVCRVIFEINILYMILPCYALMCILLFFSPRIFSAIAFDSGGVASGSMSASFLLPFVIGICTALGNDIMVSVFGTIALVATVPILSLQCLGLIYKITKKRRENKIRKLKSAKVEILEFDVGVVS